MTESTEQTPEPLAPTPIDKQRGRRDLIAGAIGFAAGVLGTAALLVVLNLIGAALSALAPSPLASAVEECDAAGPYIRIGDDGASLWMSTKGEEAEGADYLDVLCVLSQLEISDSTLSRMNSTRALDGRQDGQWQNFDASWSYHPNSGLDVVIEIDRD